MARGIYVQVTSGFGNQMFQYAMGRAMAARNGLPFVLDLSWFERPKGKPRPYGLNVFDLKARVAPAEELRDIMSGDFARRFGLVSVADFITPVPEPQLHFWRPALAVRGPAYLGGFWQSPRYFEDFSDLVRQDFAFPPLPAEAEPMAGRITGAPNAVAVHVRRGDYLTDGRLGSCCPAHYYREGIARLAAKVGPLNLFVFSDEPDWVRQNFDPSGHAMEVVDFPAHVDAPHHDMHLMSLARHHVIANSTFSWWGAWLAKGDTVIAPGRWFANAGPETQFGTVDRYPLSWMRV
jgi:hypothetical protein